MKTYEMNPRTDQVMFTRDLEEGMQAMMEFASFRKREDFGKVIRVHVWNEYANVILEYPGGHQQSTGMTGSGMGWIVKKDSIPEQEE